MNLFKSPIKALTILTLIILISNDSKGSTENCSHHFRVRMGKYDDKLQVTRDILTYLEKYSADRGIKAKIEILKTSVGDLKEFPALRIMPGTESPANLEAMRMAEDYGGLKLYLSPYELEQSGSSAFFKPDGTMIGVPYEFLDDPLHESYLHEKMHATTYLRILTGDNGSFAGSFKILKGDKISPYNYGAYNRHVSIDEILTTELSVELNIKKLYERFKAVSKESFLKNQENESLLESIHLNITNLIGISDQSEDIMRQVRSKIQRKDYSISRRSLNLGDRIQKEIIQFEILVNSSERIFENGKGIDSPVPEGVKVILLATTDNQKQILERVERIIEASSNFKNKYAPILKMIGLRASMYPELSSTNIENFIRAFQSN